MVPQKWCHKNGARLHFPEWCQAPFSNGAMDVDKNGARLHFPMNSARPQFSLRGAKRRGNL